VRRTTLTNRIALIASKVERDPGCSHSGEPTIDVRLYSVGATGVALDLARDEGNAD